MTISVHYKKQKAGYSYPTFTLASITDDKYTCISMQVKIGLGKYVGAIFVCLTSLAPGV